MKNIKRFILPITLFIMFILFTIIVKYVDVQRIGETNTQVGLSSVNSYIYNLFKDSKHANLWYDISEYLGLVSFIPVAIFALIGAYQLIKRKKLTSVDSKLYVLASFYIVVVIFYILFEKVIINYRPVFVDGVLEASYPSSHTLLAICLLGSSIILFNDFISKNIIVNIIYKLIAILLIITIILGRLISSMHWFTDIIGGIILSLTLISMFKSVISLFDKNSTPV